MESRNEANTDQRQASGRMRSRWILATLLVLVTLGIGAASRAERNPGSGGDNASLPVAFDAHGKLVSFSGQLDRTRVLQGSDGTVRMELVLGADEVPGIAPRIPTDLIVVLDRSGSMAGEKIAHAHAAIHELVARLGAADRFSLVSYSNGARVDIPLSPANPLNRDRWSGLISGVGPNGGTNMSAGLDRGLQIADTSRAPGRVPRVILISDGLANQGDSSRSGLVSRATRAARGEYVLSTVGVGEDFNESLMTALADAGTGNYYYLQNARNLAKVFAGEFEAARATVASGLAIDIQPAPGVTVMDAAGYPLERVAGAVRVRPGALFSGQERRIWVTLSVPTDGLRTQDLGRFGLAYTANGKRHELSFDRTPRVVAVATKQDFLSGLDPEAWERAVAEEEYGVLKGEVATAVREGRRDEALQKIRSYQQKNIELNATMQSAPVAESLDAASGLMLDVQESFSGPNQEAKRKRSSKTLQQEAVDQRRAGAKK